MAVSGRARRFGSVGSAMVDGPLTTSSAWQGVYRHFIDVCAALEGEILGEDCLWNSDLSVRERAAPARGYGWCQEVTLYFSAL
jgi:hypothetical protein